MNRFNLEELEINNDRVKSQLTAFLNRVSMWKYHNDEMQIRVYVDSKGDFVYCEAVKYSLSFFSNAHKIRDLYESKYAPAVVQFQAFRDKVLSLV